MDNSFRELQQFFTSYQRTGNFLPKGVVNHLPKKLSQVAQIFTKKSSTKRNEGHTLLNNIGHTGIWLHTCWKSILLEVQAVNQSSFEVKLFMRITNVSPREHPVFSALATTGNTSAVRRLRKRHCSRQKLKLWGLYAGKELFSCRFVFVSSLLLTQRVLIVKEMLMCFVFHGYLGAAGKKTKTKTSSLPQYFARIAAQCAFWQRNRRKAWA